MEQIKFVINYSVQFWNELTNQILKNPEQIIHSQIKFWQDCQQLCQEEPLEQIVADKRFQHKEWQNNPLFSFIKRLYLLLSNHIEILIQQISHNDEKISKKLKLFSRQFLDALSPSNFTHTNPEVLLKVVETHGTNLIEGYKQLLSDFKDGKLNIKTTDLGQFKLGKNIACTKGSVIYQNHLMQLIQYTATTKDSYQYPLLIIPPWINKYYVLDLQPETSLVKWLVDQGITVFMISWVNPTNLHKEIKFEDYMVNGPLVALSVINAITEQKQLNALGYCIGGTLLSCLLAYLAQQGNPSIISATFLTTLLDFSEPGELGAFIAEDQLSTLEDHMKKTGYLDGNIMMTVFNSLRANDLIWSPYINHYLKGQRPKAFDLLYWNADPTNIPELTHSFYLRNMYLNNNLIKPNKIILNGTPLDLNKITIPCYFLAAQDDHIVPWESAYKGQQYLSGKSTFVLTRSGHVAGVVNSAHKQKYGYWTNSKNYKSSKKYLESAQYHEGSWWLNWIRWLIQYSGNLRPLNELNMRKPKSIEKAPGSYVKARLPLTNIHE